jgi:hypothetical protein
VLLQAALMIVDRYVARTDTKKPIEESKFGGKAVEEGKMKNFFKQDEIFKRTSTERSMTIKLKTMKTVDLDMQGAGAQDLLNTLNNSEAASEVESNMTKITSQQKTKFMMHWFLLIFVHIYIFYYVPLSSSFAMFGQPQCRLDQLEHYPCKNFEYNYALQILYILYCIKLWLSARQLSVGLPIMRAASTLFLS